MSNYNQTLVVACPILNKEAARHTYRTSMRAEVLLFCYCDSSSKNVSHIVCPEYSPENGCSLKQDGEDSNCIYAHVQKLEKLVAISAEPKPQQDNIEADLEENDDDPKCQ